MRSLYKRLKSNTRFQEIYLWSFFMLALLTFFFDAISPNCLATKCLKDFIMPVLNPLVFLIFGIINTENEKIEHKLNKH